MHYKWMKEGWMDYNDGYNDIITTQVAAISCLREFKVY